MSMDRAAFEALVARMEALAAQDLPRYRRRVFGLAALGYAYLTALVIVLAAITVALALSVIWLKALGIKLAIVAGGLLVVVVRALWVKLEPPTGLALARDQAPDLFALIDSLRQRLEIPTVHFVLLTPEFNAGVTQIPRFGLLGGHRNYLLIGLPLMKVLSVAQFEAVLAHEFGHLSRGHARASNWIYRLRLMWERLAEGFRERSGSWGAVFVRPFFGWYIPYFQACSFPLARINEYQADAASVQLTSARSAAQALSSVSLVGAWLNERYWPSIHAAAKDQPQPAFAPYASLDTGQIIAVPEADRHKWLHEALTGKTSLADTHPALTDRLAAIGAQAEIEFPAAGESSDRLLGAHRAVAEQHFDDRWREAIAAGWARYHAEVQTRRTRLAQLRALADRPEAEALELASLEADVGDGAGAALGLLRELSAHYPDSLPVQFALARQLLEQNEAEGVALMEDLIAREPGAEEPGSALLRDYHWRCGERVQAESWHARFAARTQLLELDRQERSHLLLSDVWLPHGMDAEQLATLRTALAAIPDLKRVWLVRKTVRAFPEQPLYALGFKVRYHYSRDVREDRAAEALQRLRELQGFPGETLILGIDRKHRLFGRKFRRIDSARIA